MNHATLIERRRTLFKQRQKYFASNCPASVLSDMFAKASIKLRYIFAFSLAMVFFASAQGQSNNQKALAVRKAKTLFVSNIEPGMPHMLLEKWFRKQVWDKPRIKWKAVDCGYEANGLTIKLPSLPVCVELSANSFDMFVGITLQISELKNGIRESDPVVRRITISREDQGMFKVDNLRALSAKLDEVLAM